MKHKVELVFDDEVNAISAGLRQNWIDGENKDSIINLSCGAGTGSPFLIFYRTNKKTKQTRYAVADIRPVINAMAKALSK